MLFDIMILMSLLVIFSVIGTYSAFQVPFRIGNCIRRCHQECNNGMICRIGSRKVLKFNCISTCQNELTVLKDRPSNNKNFSYKYDKAILSYDAEDLIANVILNAMKRESQIDHYRSNRGQVQRRMKDIFLKINHRRTKRAGDLHGAGEITSNIKNRFSFGGLEGLKTSTNVDAKYQGKLQGKGSLNLGNYASVNGDFSSNGQGHFTGNMDTKSKRGKGAKWNGGWEHGGTGDIQGKANANILGLSIAQGEGKAGGEYQRDVITEGNYHNGLVNVQLQSHTVGSGYAEGSGSIGLFGFGIGGNIIASGGGDLKGDYDITFGRGPVGWMLTGGSDNQVKGSGTFDATVYG